MYKEMFYTDDLENLTEELVFEALYDRVQGGQSNFCQCQVCIQDIAALVLNHVPAKYQSSYIEKQNPRAKQVEEMQILKQKINTQLDLAIALVNQQPHH